jgi:hypothetical protein
MTSLAYNIPNVASATLVLYLAPLYWGNYVVPSRTYGGSPLAKIG